MRVKILSDDEISRIAAKAILPAAGDGCASGGIHEANLPKIGFYSSGYSQKRRKKLYGCVQRKIL